jgi:hypothetical protein
VVKASDLVNHRLSLGCNPNFYQKALTKLFIATGKLVVFSCVNTLLQPIFN